MRRAIIASVVLFSPSLSWGDEPKISQGQIVALQRSVLRLTDEVITWQGFAIDLQATIDQQKKTIDDLSKRVPADGPAKNPGTPKP